MFKALIILIYGEKIFFKLIKGNFLTVKYNELASHIHSKPLWFVETNHIAKTPAA